VKNLRSKVDETVKLKMSKQKNPIPRMSYQFFFFKYYPSNSSSQPVLFQLRYNKNQMTNILHSCDLQDVKYIVLIKRDCKTIFKFTFIKYQRLLGHLVMVFGYWD